MSTSTTFQTQIAAIMDVLAKAAIAEISKLVEDDHVVIRLEMCRKENEIETLKKRLFFTERDLRKAQRAAIRVIPERVSVGIQVESLGHEYPLVNSNPATEDTVLKDEEKTSLEDQMASFIQNGDQEMVHNLTHNSGDVGEADFALKKEPEEVQVGQVACLTDCEYRSESMHTQSVGGEVDKLAQSWPSFEETHCQMEGEDPGCSYNTQQNSSSEANLFSVGTNEDGSRDFPADLHLDLFNSVSVKEEGVCMSVSQNFPDAVVQSKDGPSKETIDMTVVQSQPHSAPRTDKGGTSYMAPIPSVASHGRPTFIPRDSQTHPTHAAIGSHIHTAQISSHSQAPTNAHTHSPYTHSFQPSRHVAMRPRTPGLMHRRGSTGVSASSHHRVFICSLCGKSYPRFCQLEAHQRSHTGVKPYRCTECGKRFTQKTRLKTHQSVHTGERPFSCRLCGKRFNRQDNCLRHERFHRAKNPSSRLSMGRGLSS